jgi:hypothetical protein
MNLLSLKAILRFIFPSVIPDLPDAPWSIPPWPASITTIASLMGIENAAVVLLLIKPMLINNTNIHKNLIAYMEAFFLSIMYK